MKEVNVSKRSKPFCERSKPKKKVYFFVYDLIKEGYNPAQIALKLGKSKQSLNKVLGHLKAIKAISKISYGEWKAHDIDIEKALKRSKPNAARPPTDFINSTVFGVYKSFGEIRGHGFRFSVWLPKIPGWENRGSFLEDKGVEGFKRIPNGVRLILLGHKVKVFNRSLDVYFNPGWSFFSDDAERAYIYAILELERIIKSFEGVLGVNIKCGGGYKFKVSRQHFSLVKNALAKQYLKEKVNLKVYNPDGGLWFVIDNSYHLEEAECCHREDARDDVRKVQDWFNGVKKTGITPDFILQGFNCLIEDREYYASNLREHVKAINDLRCGVNDLVRVVKEFKKGI